MVMEKSYTNVEPRIIICLIGPPCSGKSTVSKRFLDLEWIDVINVGAMLRNSTNTRIQNILTSGNYVDSNILISLLNQKIRNEVVILDGFPRDLVQLNDLKDTFPGTSTYFIELVCPNKTCTQRAFERKRCDDLMIRERLNKHIAETTLFYKDLKSVEKVDATESPHNVYETVKCIIEKLKCI